MRRFLVSVERDECEGGVDMFRFRFDGRGNGEK